MTWQAGDPVRLESDLPLLHDAVGHIVQTDVPGPMPYRVRVEGRRGLGLVLVRDEELRER